MNARNADIKNALNAMAHQLGGDRGFFGNRDVTRSRTHHENEAVGVGGDFFFPNNDQPGLFVIFCFRSEFFNCGKGFDVSAGRQNVAFALVHFLNDLRNLIGRFAFAKNRFGEAPPLRAVVVDLRES